MNQPLVSGTSKSLGAFTNRSTFSIWAHPTVVSAVAYSIKMLTNSWHSRETLENHAKLKKMSKNNENKILKMYVHRSASSFQTLDIFMANTAISYIICALYKINLTWIHNKLQIRKRSFHQLFHLCWYIQCWKNMFQEPIGMKMMMILYIGYKNIRIIYGKRML